MKRRRGRCHLVNVMRCGLIWECPTCQAHIKAERAQEAETVKAWHIAERVNSLSSTGWSPQRKLAWAESTACLATFTIRHGLGDDPKILRTGLTAAWKRFLQGAWKALRDELREVGSIKAMEPTWGAQNGWHPHLHVALFFEAPPPADLEKRLFNAWYGCVVATLGAEHAPVEGVTVTDEGGRPTWTPVGVVVTPCNQANYLSKLGLEVSSPNTKAAREGHLTPLDMLGLAGEALRLRDHLLREFRATGDLELLTQADSQKKNALRWLKLYRSYVDAMRGARQLTWSVGLKAAAGVIEKSDEDVVAGSDEKDELVFHFTRAEFQTVRQVPGGIATALELGETHGPGAVGEFVRLMVDDFEKAVKRELRRRGVIP